MRRPPGLWILLSAGVVWLSLQDVYGIRATSLIFGKSTTTTTTSTTTTTPEQPEASEEETVTTELGNDANATKPTLTGNPQVDYIWDPNLPKELNGYNLSDYPFYERVPEEIDFKCDGLHDGFYASVIHKCQVYHHCLFGTRYDFLCANYTAFDQKTFICHFASEVDCVNSKKFWHRNDALYKAATTTTIKPFVIYTSPPQSSSVTISPLPLAPSGPSGPGFRRPVGGRRRPFRRRRPQFDYYEDDYYDYYEERPRSNRGRKRPRPRPRPLYDDEYDEVYEDDRYERRGGSRRDETRRPYDRRPTSKRRNKDRVNQDYEEEPDAAYEDKDVKLNSRRKPNDRKPPIADESEEERYPESRKQNKRRPSNDRIEEISKKPDRNRNSQRRPASDDYEDTFQTDDSRGYDRPRKSEQERRTRPTEETRTIIKPVSGTIYDRPRVAPRIKLPVPKNEADKYSYKPVTTQAAVAAEDEEYYDDYEEKPVPVRKKNIRKPEMEYRNTRTKLRENDEDNSRKQTGSAARSRPRRPDASYENFKRPRSKDRPVSEEYYDEYDEEEDEERSIEKRPSNSSVRREKSSTSTTTTTSTTSEKPQQPVVRVVKRPFLPSRGGNPYSSRGLQPVGTKALEKEQEQSSEITDSTEEESPYDEMDKAKDEKQVYLLPDEAKTNDETQTVVKQSPLLTKVPGRASLPVAQESLRPQLEVRPNYNVQDTAGLKKTQQSEGNPLDINQDDYDVTLNDALNPTLPNLPVRGSPVGFTPNNDYTFSSFQRPRYVLEPVVGQGNSDYVYQTKPLTQYDQSQGNVRDRFVSSNTDYRGQYSTIRESYRPRQQQQTEAFYSRY